MAQKKLLHKLSTTGKVKVVTGSYYDDSNDTLTIRNLTFNTMSLDLPDGLAFIENNTITSSAAQDRQVVLWNNTTGKWVMQSPELIDVVVSASVPTSNSDLSGTFADIKVKSLSNVNTGSALPVIYGGTGLNTSSYPTGEAILLGNGTGPFGFLTASSSPTEKILVSTATGWDYIDQPYETGVEVSIFTSSATWTKPTNTKMIRVLAQGGGGGGGSGANRRNSLNALGGGGGGAGGFIDTGIFLYTENNASVVVGSGGLGGVVPTTGSSGIPGGDGGSSSFANYVYANGGNGGAGGVINSTTATAGGAAVTFGARNVYNDIFIANSIATVTDAGDAGGTSTLTIGSNTTYTPAANVYYGVGGGAGGGSLQSGSYTVNYAGGTALTSPANGGTIASVNAGSAVSASVINNTPIQTDKIISTSQTNNIFIASGGGGGASPTVTQSLGDTLVLHKFVVTDGPKDYSIYNNGGALWTNASIMNSPVGYPGTAFANDGVLSCSYNAADTTPAGYSSYFPTIGTSNFTHQFWIYLHNIGSSTVDANARSWMFGQSTGFAFGLSGSNQFVIWDSTKKTVSGITYTNYNQWNHIAFVRNTPTSVTVYYNGTASAAITVVNVNYASPNLVIGSNGFSAQNINGYIKDFKTTNRALTAQEIQTYYNDVKAGLSGSFTPPSEVLQSYLGGVGGNGAWGSGGGGGGASTNAASNLTTYDMETVSLVPSNLSDVTFKDKSIYNNTITSKLVSLVSTSSAGIPAINSLMSDGVVSSSYIAQQASGPTNLYTTTKANITDNFTLESWFYLKNAGQSGDNNYLSNILMAGYVPSPGTGVLIGINSSNNLVVWTGAAGAVTYGPGNNPRTITYNNWNHIAITKSGTTHTLYLNGTSSVYTGTSAVSNNQFGYGLGNSIYSQYNPNGFFKEFVLTNRIKAAQEIQDYYNAVKNNLSGSYQNPSVGAQQGGNGGDGYVAVISYKF